MMDTLEFADREGLALSLTHLHRDGQLCAAGLDAGGGGGQGWAHRSLRHCQGSLARFDHGPVAAAAAGGSPGFVLSRVPALGCPCGEGVKTFFPWSPGSASSQSGPP